MSNHNQNKPKLNLPPPPPAPLEAAKNAPELVIRRTYAKLLDKFPLPWVVGPHGDVWVAADVESYDPEKETSWEKVPGPNGTWWRTREGVAKPRLVFEPTDNEIAALTVDVVNALLA